MKSVVGGVAVLILTTGGALAQPAGPGSPFPRVRDRYVVSATGATVDKPGVPQASGTTTLDRRIQRQDQRIDHSLCNGC